MYSNGLINFFVVESVNRQKRSAQCIKCDSMPFFFRVICYLLTGSVQNLNRTVAKIFEPAAYAT